MAQFENHKNIVSSRLAQARKKSNFSQETLAVKMQIQGISIDHRTISKIEHDQRLVTDYELLCFCKALKIELAWLLGDFC